jgi:hypothetical protein
MDCRSWLSTRVISGSTARPEPGESALRFEVQAPDGVSKDQEDGKKRGRNSSNVPGVGSLRRRRQKAREEEEREKAARSTPCTAQLGYEDGS